MPITKDDLIKKVQQEIDFCESLVLPMNPTYAKTQPNYLAMIDLYMSSKYRDGDTDIFGLPKPFYNIVTLPVDVASKMIDLDTKNIVLMAEDQNYWETWFMEKELHYWMKDTYFGNALNEFTYLLPRNGHLVVKKVGDKIESVPLKNLRVRPNALSLKSTPIVEIHLYQRDEFLAEAKKRDWKDANKVVIDRDNIVLGDYMDGNVVPVYEAWFPKGYLDYKNNYFLITSDGTVLAESVQDCPYKDIYWDKVEGRLFGKGQVEKLFNAQIYINRMANYKAEGLYWSSKKLFQTRDNMIARNLLSETDNGDVLTVNSEITPITSEERNLSFYNYDEGRWERNSLRQTFTNDPIVGQRSPSGTTLGGQMLDAQMSATYYKQKRENLANFIKEILYDWVLPDFQKKTRAEHEIMIANILSGDGNSEKLLNYKTNTEVNKKIIEMMARGKLPTASEIKMIKSLAYEKVKADKITIPKGTYDNLKYKLNIVITGEEIDSQAKVGTLQMILSLLASNPTIFQNPATKGIAYSMLDMAGINPNNVDITSPQSIEETAMQMQPQRGGSIAAPVPMRSNIQTKTTI
jgi:hypothetical protein